MAVLQLPLDINVGKCAFSFERFCKGAWAKLRGLENVRFFEFQYVTANQSEVCILEV